MSLHLNYKSVYFWWEAHITVLWVSELILWESELTLWVNELILWVSDLIRLYFGCLNLDFGCLNLYFGCLDLYFKCLNLYFRSLLIKPLLIKCRPVGTTYAACLKADQVPLLIKKLAIIGIGGEGTFINRR